MTDPLGELEDKVTNAVLAKVAKQSMEVDGDVFQEARLQELEAKIEMFGKAHQELTQIIQDPRCNMWRPPCIPVMSS